MLNLPGELSHFLHLLGFKWPEADETKLFQMGKKWMEFSHTAKDIMDKTQQAASKVWEENKGQDIQAFANHIQHSDGPLKILKDSATAANIVGIGMTIVSAIVLALKISVISQLVTLAIQIAQAIAAAVATFGASLAEIPIFEEISKRIVGMLIDQVIGKLLKA